MTYYDCEHIHTETQTAKDGDTFVSQEFCYDCAAVTFLEVPITEVVETAARCGIKSDAVLDALENKFNINTQDIAELDHEDASALIQYLLENQQQQDLIASLQE